MSIIFGLLKNEEGAVTEPELRRHAAALTGYATDGLFIGANGRIGMGFQPYYTHERSRLEVQPLSDSCGNMIVLDGRLDNHKELCDVLDIDEPDTSDSAIILSAFRRWNEGSFCRIVGDWALAIWSATDQALYLARDHAGTRTLYFEKKNGIVRWSTFLETFFVDNAAYDLDEGYAIRYLSLCSLSHHSIHSRTFFCSVALGINPAC